MANREIPGQARSRPGPLLLPAAVVAAALLAGSATALLGGMAGSRAIYYVAVAGLLAAGIGIALTRPEPLRFIFLALLALLPLANTPVPPGRLGLTVFDFAIVALTGGLLLHKAFAAPGTTTPLFASRWFAGIWLLLLPCALLARHAPRASVILLLMFCVYVFFWFAVQELRRPRGFERIAGLLSLAALVVATGICIDHFLHVNLSLRGGNLNQLSYSGGMQIWRAGGFFQDPQKAGAFLASLLVFLLVLGIRGRFVALWPRLLLWSALLPGVPALFLTVSRAAILAFVVVTTLVLVAGSRWPLALRLAGSVGLLLFAVLLLVSPAAWTALLPAALEQRLLHSQSEFQFRADIWLDTWDMFAHRPLSGIGFGGFQSYLLETRPLVLNFYGIGADSGVTYVPDQPESGYFKILYETGILGSSAALLVAGATLRRAIAGIARSEPGSALRSELVAALAGLLCFLLTFVTLFTTGDPRILALLAILLAVVWRAPPLQPIAVSA